MLHHRKYIEGKYSYKKMLKIIRGLEIKTARHYYCTLIRMSVIKDFQFQMLARMQSNWNSHPLLAGT